MKKCPDCGSLVKDEKVKCPVCQYDFTELNVTKKPSNIQVTRTKKAVYVTGAYFINRDNAAKMPNYFKVLFTLTAVLCFIAGAIQIGIVAYGTYSWIKHGAEIISKDIPLYIMYANAPILFICFVLLIIIQAMNCSWITNKGVKKTKTIFLPDIVCTGIVMAISISYPFFPQWFFVIVLSTVFFAPILIAMGVQLIRNRMLITTMHKVFNKTKEYQLTNKI